MKLRKRRIVSFVLIFCMVLSLSISSAYATNYKDTSSHWAKTQINKWSNLNIIGGSNNKFRPNDYITRGELAKVFDNLMRYQNKAKTTFSDLDKNTYSDALLKAVYAGIMSGNKNKIRPNDYITREEAIVIFSKALNLKPTENKTSLKFKDTTKISGWAVGSIKTMYGKKYIDFMVIKGIFNPKAKITRAEVVTLLDNSIKSIYKKEGIYSEKVKGNVIVNCPKVTLKNMEITGNLIIAEGVGQGNIFLDNVKVTGDIIVKGGGKNSDYLKNVSVSGSLIVNKHDGQVRIVPSGLFSISSIILQSGAIFQPGDLQNGQIDEIDISSLVTPGQTIILYGKYKTVKNNAENITIQAIGSIENLILTKRTIVTGGAAIKSVTTSMGADSVINGIHVAGNQTNVSLGTPPNPNNNGGAPQSTGSAIAVTPGGIVPPPPPPQIKYNKVSFQVNGGSAVSSINVINGSRVTLPTDPTKTGYIFMGWFTDSELTNQFNTSTPITSDITLYAKWGGWEKPVFIDSRFEAGYPKFAVSPDKKIKLIVKLKNASTQNPIDTFMLVNQMNSIIDASSKDVIHGHCGDEDGLVEVDEAPFINITDTNEHEIQTQVPIKGNSNIKMYFVLKDKVGSISSEPTVIEFLGDSVSEQDNVAPELYSSGIYINKANDKITLYFDEALNQASVPATGAFTIRDGTTESSITVSSINIKNLAPNKGVVELSVVGISDSSNLTVDYNVPTDGFALQDNAISPNKVDNFYGRIVKNIVYSVSAEDVVVSSQGNYIYIKMNFALQDYDTYDYSISKGPDSQSATPINTDSNVLRIWSNSGDYHKMYISLDNLPSLSPGDKYFITLIPSPRTGTATDFAGDNVTSNINIEVSPQAQNEENTVPDSVIYNTSANTITANFPQDSGLCEDSGLFGCLFTLNIDGQAYVLRDKLFFSNGQIVISQKNVPVDMTSINWTNVTLSYNSSIHNCFDSDTQLTYKSGKPYSGFTNTQVSVSP